MSCFGVFSAMVSKTFDPRWLVALALGSGTILVESGSFSSYYDPSFFPAHRTKRFAETCLVILLITVRKVAFYSCPGLPTDFEKATIGLHVQTS